MNWDWLVLFAPVVGGLLLGWCFRDEPVEMCCEPGCYRGATHERFEGVTADGMPMTMLVCRRHGGLRRQNEETW